MKTLKKTLCLVLAVVMVLGLCAISASAKLEYTDNDKITYEEAVDVMSGIGVLQGDERGFRPKDPITRAEAAKIIAYIMIGNAAQADALKTTTDPFTDVPANYWASGYIAYCAAAGIVTGRGDGTFDPYAQVTGLEFAKMLLGALGYGQKNEYIGAEWSINVSKDGLRYGIYDGNPAGASGTPATREECALYAFNTIAGTKDYTGIGKVSYSELLGNYINNAMGSNPDANKGTYFWQDFDLYNTRNDEDDDEFGRIDGYYWYVKKDTNRVSNYYINGDKLKNVYTSKVTGADIYKLLGKSFIDGLDNNATHVKIYQNGGTTAKTYTPDSAALPGIAGDADNDAFAVASFKKDGTKPLMGTGNGVQTYVYAWEEYNSTSEKVEKYLQIAIIDTYLAQVTKVTKASDTKEPSTEVKLANLTENGNLTSKAFETDEFDVDDYVLVTIADNEIQSMVPAIVKEGEITRFTSKGNDKKITAAGVDYEFAKENAVANFNGWESSANITNVYVNGKDYNLYVDEYGYLIAIDEITGDNSYVYVAQFGHKYGSVNGLTDSDNLTAHVYYADGTDAILFVDAEASGLAYTDKDSLAALNGETSDTASKNKLEQLATVDPGATGIYKLTMSKGKATLENKGNAVAGMETTLQRGVTKIATNVDANDKTVFFYLAYGNGYDKKGYSVKAYTGVRNIPVTGKDDTITPKNVIVDAKVAKAVLATSDVAPESNDIVYLYNGKYTKLSVGGDKFSVTYEGYAVDSDTPDALVEICTKTFDSDQDAKDDIIRTNAFIQKFVKVEDSSLDEVATTTAPEKLTEKVWYINGATLAADSSEDKNATVINKISIIATGADDGKYYAADATYVDLRTGVTSKIGSIADLAELVAGTTPTTATVSFRSTNASEITVIFILPNPS